MALIQIRQRNEKFYRQPKAKTIQHNQTSITFAKGTSLRGKEKDKTRNKKIMNRKANW